MIADVDIDIVIAHRTIREARAKKIISEDDFHFRVARSIDTLCQVGIITRDQRNRAIRWMVRNPDLFNYESERTVLDAASFAVQEGNPGWEGLE